MILLVGVGVLSIYYFLAEADSYSTMDTQKYREWTGHISEEEKSRECSRLERNIEMEMQRFKAKVLDFFDLT